MHAACRHKFKARNCSPLVSICADDSRCAVDLEASPDPCSGRSFAGSCSPPWQPGGGVPPAEATRCQRGQLPFHVATAAPMGAHAPNTAREEGVPVRGRACAPRGAAGPTAKASSGTGNLDLCSIQPGSSWPPISLDVYGAPSSLQAGRTQGASPKAWVSQSPRDKAKVSGKTLIEVCLAFSSFLLPYGFGTYVYEESVCVEEMRIQASM